MQSFKYAACGLSCFLLAIAEAQDLPQNQTESPYSVPVWTDVPFQGGAHVAEPVQNQGNLPELRNAPPEQSVNRAVPIQVEQSNHPYSVPVWEGAPPEQSVNRAVPIQVEQSNHPYSVPVWEGAPPQQSVNRAVPIQVEQSNHPYSVPVWEGAPPQLNMNTIIPIVPIQNQASQSSYPAGRDSSSSWEIYNFSEPQPDRPTCPYPILEWKEAPSKEKKAAEAKKNKADRSGQESPVIKWEDAPSREKANLTESKESEKDRSICLYPEWEDESEGRSKPQFPRADEQRGAKTSPPISRCPTSAKKEPALPEKRRAKGATAAKPATFAPRYPQTVWEDVFAQKRIQFAENMEPVIVHTQDQEEAVEKLTEAWRKFGKRPNILIFMMNKVGYGDLGAFGGGTAIGAPTPHMDKLCREGLQLTATYSQPNGSSTRATLLTGRLPMRHGFFDPLMFGASKVLDGEVTLARILNIVGYRTQAIGEWHLGKDEASQPQNIGFDDFCGFLSSFDGRDFRRLPELSNNPKRARALIRPSEEKQYLVHGIRGQPLENVEELTSASNSTVEQKMADYGVKFLQAAAGKEQPFFLYFSAGGGSFDHCSVSPRQGQSPAKYPFKDAMIEMDRILGRLVKTLDEAHILENTLIFITSDSGPEMESWPDSGFTPFRGSKGSTFEGGVRVPGIVYWKGVIQPGRVSDGLFDLADLFTTGICLAGAADYLPTDRYIDGIDQTSFLLADQGKSNRASVFYWLLDNFSAARVAEYKLIQMATVPTCDTPNGGGLSGKDVDYTYGHLFNLYLDPKEEHNILVGKLPFYKALTQEIERHLGTFRRYPPKFTPNSFSNLQHDR
jgi:arylsulfatase